MSMKSILVITLLVFSVVQAQEHVTYEDIAKMNKITSYIVSPDSKWTVYTVNYYDFTDSKSYTYLKAKKIEGVDEEFIIGNNTTQKTSYSSPTFISKDGKDYLLFLSEGYIKYLPFPGAKAAEAVKDLVFYPVKLNSFKAVSNMLVFTVSVYPEFINELSLTANKDRHEEARRGPNNNTFYVYDKLMVRHWNVWYDFKLNQLFSHKLIIDNTTGTVSTDGFPVNRFHGMNIYIPEPPLGTGDMYDLKADGTEAIFSALEKNDKEAFNTNWITYTSDLVADISFPEVFSYNQIARTTSPKYSPSGKQVAFLAMEQKGVESGNFNFRFFDTTTKSIFRSYSIDRNVDYFTWLNEDVILFEFQDSFDLKIGYLNFQVQDTTITLESTEKLSILGGFQVIPNSFNVLCMRSSIDTPAELYVFKFKNVFGNTKIDAFRQITKETNLDSTKLISKYAEVEATALDGTKIYGRLLIPDNYDKTKDQKYPVILNIHGGPEASWPNIWSSSFVTSQILSKDKFILLVNPRGSEGRGQKFKDAVRLNWGGTPYEDLMLVFDSLDKNEFKIDTTKACAMGGSYGGYMTNWIRTLNTSDDNRRFKCFITDDGVFNTHTATYNTEELWFNFNEFCTQDEHGVYKEECRPYLDEYKENFEKYSPEKNLSNPKFDTKSPHLIIHGQNDFRLTWSEGQGMFAALRMRNIPAEYLFFFEEGHSVTDPRNRVVWDKHINAFLNKHIPFEPLPPTPTPSVEELRFLK